MSRTAEMLIAARVFGIAAVVGLALLLGDSQAWISVIALVGTAAATASLGSAARAHWLGPLILIEAVVVAILLGLSLPAGAIMLPYAMVIFLLASLTAGTPGLLLVAATQPFVVTIAFRVGSGDWLENSALTQLVPWLLTGLGLGLLGLWVRRMNAVPARPDDVATYAAAHRLLTQLRPLARRLSSGLDPEAVGSQLLSLVDDAFNGHRAGIFLTTTTGQLLPVATTEGMAFTPFQLSGGHETSRRPHIDQDAQTGEALISVPLLVGNRWVGVAMIRSSAMPDARRLNQLELELNRHALRLETALVFDEIRSVATLEERRRLAREIHDGIAQEIAALGYQTDAILAHDLPANVTGSLQQLRSELTRVVRELRLSIFDLRHNLESGDGFGAALSEYVRRVGNQSDLTVHLSLDERGRLRPETELELLRISQEAVTNARKHAKARNLWVTCEIAPPFADIQIRDDGIGPGKPSEPTSYGFAVMRERAERIDAQLEIREGAAEGTGGGTLVRVSLGCRPPAHEQEGV